MSSYGEEALAAVAVPVAAVGAGVLAVGAAAVAVAASPVVIAASAVYEVGKVAGRAVYAVGKSGVEISKELEEFFNAGKTEKEAYKTALNNYQNITVKNQENHKKYIAKLKKNISPEVFSLKDNWLNDINDDNSLIDLIRLQTYILNIENIFNLNSFDSALEDEFYSLRENLEKNIGKKIINFSTYLEAFVNLLTAIKQEVSTKKYDNLCKNIDSIIFEVNNIVENPLIIIFYNELLDSLKNSQEKNQEIIDYDKELILRKNNISNIIKECSSISHPCQSLAEFNDLLFKVKEQLSNNNLSSKEKVKLCDMHYKWLCDSYIKIKLDYKWFEESKKRFDTLNDNYAKCLTVLNRPLENVEFNFENPEESIHILENKIKAISQEAENESKVILTLKSIDSVMKRNGFRKITSKTINIKNKTIHKEIYHLENGNIVSFFISPDSFKFSVSGVKIDGTEKDVYSINQSQVHMCELKKEINKMLKSYGIETSTKELIKPEIRFAAEIELEDVSYDQIEFLKSQKRKNTVSQRQSKRIGG